MAHHIESIGGQAAFASARTVAWHRLGTVLPDAMTADQALNAALLKGWNVRKLPISATDLTDSGVATVDCPDRFMTVRTNPATRETEYLGVVSEGYSVIQNEEAADFLQALVDSSGAVFETAGSLHGGRKVFVSMKAPESVKIGGVDQVNLYLTFSTSHDGTSAHRVIASPVRVVCQNTLSAAIRRSVGQVVVRHTANARLRLAQAREAIGLTFDHFDVFTREAERMLNEQYTLDQLRELVDQLWPLPDDAKPDTRRRHARRAASLAYLHSHADTVDGITGTRWSAYQAVTEYLDHHAPAADPHTRALRAVTTATPLKQKAFAALAVTA